MTGTGRSSACITKHPRSAFRITRATRSGGVRRLQLERRLRPQHLGVDRVVRTAPVTRNRVRTRMVIRVTVTFSMCPYRDTWVISQKASAALKYMSGVGAEPSPPRLGPSSHANVM